MSPQRIIKTGNAGNSSRLDKIPTKSVNEEKPLFPPGSKYPLSLLHERCQKEGWEKPSIDTRKQDGGWSFAIILSKINKRTSQRESVRLEPHPPYIRPTIPEARHWGATYALYRCCNGIQLNRVLPTGPRDYWNELAAEHKRAPEHLQWMYNADPFAARKDVNDRQAKAAKKKELASQDPSSGARGFISDEFAHSPEVKMAIGLRELVENAVKKAICLYPEIKNAVPSILCEDDMQNVAQQLEHLGFKSAQSRSAVDFLSEASPLTSNLLESLTPLEAAIEYLVLHVPECDLPSRFLPVANSSSPFVTSTHVGTDNLKRRWIEEKAVKEAGWPAHVVRDCLSDPRLLENWELLILALGNKLVGDEWASIFVHSPSQRTAMCTISKDEVDALGAYYVDPCTLVMPLFSAPVKLHILESPINLPESLSSGHPPMYIASPSVPAYIRLHLLARLLQAIKLGNFVESDEGFLVAAMRLLEGEWATIEDHGPPKISTVLQHLVPRPIASTNNLLISVASGDPTASRARNRAGGRRSDNRTNDDIKKAFRAMCNTEKYKEILATRTTLPAFSAKEEFLSRLEQSRVVVVVGETGCGKTTQLPQFILDSLILSDRGSEVSILVTQPRRISAISVAARVAFERLDDGSAGYSIRGESKYDHRTKLLFCTTGVVLSRLGSGDTLDGVTHIIVDEVHERSVDSDFLLLELKDLLNRHSSLKIVLMSATINHETFVKYFDGAPLLSISGFTHQVQDIYLEDVIPLIGYRPPIPKSSNKHDKRAFWDEYKSKGLDDQSVYAIQNIIRSDRIDYQLIARVLGHIIATAPKGGVLIFLPGVQEIRQCIEAAQDVVSANDADVIPLHANLSSKEQRQVFAPTSRWKIIVATNVAETSITIDDVIYVIDAGKVKEIRYDAEYGLSRLVETWVTQAAAKQRRGRAGRTQSGVCYKLYTRKQEEQMARFPVPEILRVPLESISLAIKAMREEEDVKLFLSRAIDPPKVVAMENAWVILENLGAVDQCGKLTALGRYMSLLPMDLRLAKMLVLGTVFQCLGPILTIVACLSSKPLFVSSLDKREEANKARARFATENSDLLTDLHTYDEFVKLRSGGKSVSAFLEENFISSAIIREVMSLRQEYLSSLAAMSLIPISSSSDDPSLNKNSASLSLLKSIILAGLWPNVARVHLPKSAIKFDKVQGGTVQRENTAREWKMYDLQEGRVFLHPRSVCFDTAVWRSGILTYFSKCMTSKVFLKDATEVPLYALLLFGGPVSVNHIAGGLTVGTKDCMIKLKAWPRIGILVNQLRRLMDAQLRRGIEEGILNSGNENPVLNTIIALLEGDGLTVDMRV